MYTERVPLLLAATTLLLLASLVLKNWGPIILVLPLAALFFISSIFYRSEKMNVIVTREVDPTQTLIGGTSTVRLKVVNKGREKIDLLEIYDKLPPEIPLKNNSNHLILSLDPEEKVTLTYEVSCPYRGRYEIGPAYLRIRDVLGFRFNETTLTEPSVIYVLPEIELLDVADLRTRHTGPWPGVVSSRWSGVGTEFYGLRRYLPGDSLRRVNWKASARMGKLITVEHESERSTDIIIILDACKASSFGTPPETPLEYSVEAAGSLAYLLLKLGNRVGLIIHGKYRSWLPPSFGKRQFHRILSELATAEAGEAVPMESVVSILIPLLLPPKSQIILISPLLTPNIFEVVKDLAVEGYSILVISPSYLDLVPPSSEMIEASKVAHKIMTLERENLIMRLRGNGVVVDWNPSLPLKAVLKGVKRWHIRTKR